MCDDNNSTDLDGCNSDCNPTGGIAWDRTFTVDGELQRIRCIAEVGDTIVVGLDWSTVGLNLDGIEVWSRDEKSDLCVASGDHIVVWKGNANGLAMLDPATGEELWSNPDIGGFAGSFFDYPLIAANPSTVVFAAAFGIATFDAQTGDPLDLQENISTTRDSSLAIAQGGDVYLSEQGATGSTQAMVRAYSPSLEPVYEYPVGSSGSSYLPLALAPGGFWIGHRSDLQRVEDGTLIQEVQTSIAGDVERISSDGDGSLIVASSSGIEKLGASQQSIWSDSDMAFLGLEGALAVVHSDASIVVKKVDFRSEGDNVLRRYFR